jgi:hypothetical protein
MPWAIPLFDDKTSEKSADLTGSIEVLLERETGHDPATYSLEGCRSTN